MNLYLSQSGQGLRTCRMLYIWERGYIRISSTCNRIFKGWLRCKLLIWLYDSTFIFPLLTITPLASVAFSLLWPVLLSTSLTFLFFSCCCLFTLSTFHLEQTRLSLAFINSISTTINKSHCFFLSITLTLIIVTQHCFNMFISLCTFLHSPSLWNNTLQFVTFFVSFVYLNFV